MNVRAPEGAQPWENIGMAFVKLFYETFDDSSRGPRLLPDFYHQTALMTFEDRQSQGKEAIKEALNKLTFQSIQHLVTKVDCQPTLENGVLIQVTGRLKTDEDPPHAFAQTFYLRPVDGNFYIFHDIFRLSIHNTI